MKKYDTVVTNPAVYSFYYRQLHEAAYNKGYALALHGSMRRDCDIIAVPWTATAIGQEELIYYLAEYIGGYVEQESIPWVGQKPFGRMAWVIRIGGALYFDISVMPITQDHGFCSHIPDRHPVTKDILDEE